MLADSRNSAKPTGIVFRPALCTTLPWPSSQRDHEVLELWVTQADRDAEPTRALQVDGNMKKPPAIL
jgi:hypothetical protein